MKRLNQKATQLLGLFLVMGSPGIVMYGHASGAGVRGGGEVVDINGQLFLRDVVERSICDTRSGKEMLDSTPEATRILSAVEKLDWYFALELRRELRFLRFCMTGPLEPLMAPSSRNLPVELSSDPTLFVGVRFGQTVNVDTELFNRLNPKMRGLFLIHETMHSYLPMSLDPGVRKRALLSIVNTIYQVAEGMITSRERLHLNMEQNHVSFPRTVELLDPYREALTFALADESDRSGIYLSTREPHTLTRKDLHQIAQYVAPWDRARTQLSPAALHREAILAILRSGTAEQVDFVLNEQTHVGVSPELIVGTSLRALPETQRLLIARKLTTSPLLKSALENLDAAGAISHEGRIAANPQLMELVGLPAHAEPLPVLRIQPLSENGELPAPYALIANLLLTLSQAGDASSIQSVLSTPNLYSALRLDRALESLSTSPVTALREREYAKQALVRARRSWIARMRTMLEGMPIDWNRLNQD